MDGPFLIEEAGPKGHHQRKDDAMIEIKTERDFLHWFAGVLSAGDLNSGLASAAMECWRSARGPREGHAAEIGRVLAAFGEVDADPASGARAAVSQKLRELVSERLEVTAPPSVIAEIEQRLAHHEGRIGGPTLEVDTRELDRLLKLVQLRTMVDVQKSGLKEHVGRMLQEMARPAKAVPSRPKTPGEQTALERDLALVDKMLQEEELLAVAREELELLSDYRDRAYQERNFLACIVARLVLDAGGVAGTFQDASGEAGFTTVVAIDLPTGQATFHMDERDERAPWERLGTYPHPWDGHTDGAKWERLGAFLQTPFQPDTPAQARWLREALIAAGEAKPAELLTWLATDVRVAHGVANRPELDDIGRIKDVRKHLDKLITAIGTVEP